MVYLLEKFKINLNYLVHGREKNFSNINLGKRKMSKFSKRKLLFITFMLTLTLISSAYAILVPNARASLLTSSQKVEVISKDVVGLDLTECTKTVQESPPDSYLDVLPQENVRYTLESNGNKVDIRYTFTNGNLRVIYVLEIQGSPLLTKTAVNTLDSTKDFLNSHSTAN
jgi:hypothetical protein